MKTVKALLLYLLPLFVLGQPQGVQNNTNDAYPSQTSLLVKTRSNWFSKDNSSNNFTVTTNGDTRPSIKSPFTGVEGSTYFDGSTDFLTFTNQTFTSSFTAECWYYQTGNPANYSILFGGPNVLTSPGNNQFYVNNSGGIGWADNSTVKISPIGTASKNQWNHIAFVRSGTTTYIFLNGSQIATVTNSASIQIDRIGDVASVGAGYSPLGYISNVRISNIARYTANFTPSATPFVADANTVLLTCQSPYSQNNNTFLDHSSNDFVITRNGNVAQGSFSPFGMNGGGSAYFDGTTDYLTLPSNANLVMGTSDFTVEFWVRFTSVGAFRRLVTTTTGAINATSLVIRLNSSNKLYAFEGSVDIVGTTTITTDTWYHVAVTRTGGTMRLYVNGNLDGSVTGATTNITEYIQTIGGYYNTTGEMHYGYLSNVRIKKGVASYTGSTLTVPTSPLTVDANTVFLWRCENAAIYDGARKNNIETVGNIVNSTQQTRFSFPTINTDGSGSYAQMPMNSNFEFGSNPFTIDGWFYLSALPSAYKRIFGGINATGATNSTFIVEIDNTNKLTGGFEHSGGYATITHSTVLTTGWHYFVLSRNNTTLSLSLDGSNQTATVSANPVLYSSSNTVFIGRWYTSGTAMDFLGNSFDLRATKNVVRPIGVLLKPDSEF